MNIGQLGAILLLLLAAGTGPLSLRSRSSSGLVLAETPSQRDFDLPRLEIKDEYFRRKCPGPCFMIRAPKLVPQSIDIIPGDHGILGVRVSGILRDAILTKVIVHLKDKGPIRLYALEGTFAPGIQKRADIGAGTPEAVDRLEITSLSPAILGPRGQLQVEFSTAPNVP